ncbi:MAG: 4-(cytidine 5'-diphospho)-2-C-methyl-D-erythritol kinase [Planctomycetota bacterium]|jgi:4-diphosphocytidyl-2-C-methyl-D-erythritol kinase
MNEQFSRVGNGLLVRAPAKINLSLLVAGKRPDGFHEIETVMAKIDLYDELLFETGHTDGIELVCKGRYPVPQGKDNLVYRACTMLYDSVGVAADPIKVTLTKNIPPGSGLGGASSDAAAALMGLNRFAGLGLERHKLIEMAARLGSDVPFFLGTPLAVCRGRGEKVEEILEKFSFRVLLILPDVSVSTKKVYENYSHNKALYDKFSAEINDFIRKKNVDLLTRVCANMLEGSCFELYKELGDLKSHIEALDASRGECICLSGSGSTMYTVITHADKDEVKYYQQMLAESIGCESLIVHNNGW